MTPYMHKYTTQEDSNNASKISWYQIKATKVITFKMSTRNNLEMNLQRLESELRTLKQALEDRNIEVDERRRLLLAVRDVEREILNTLRDLRDLTELENERMRRAIETIERMKNK